MRSSIRSALVLSALCAWQALGAGCKNGSTPATDVGALDQAPASSPWVKWPTQTYAAAGQELAVARGNLLKNNMVDTNDGSALDKDPLTGSAIVCSERSKRARTLDGSCNQQERPAVGMRGMTFGRNVRERATYPERNSKGQPLVSPEPAEVADRLFTRDEFVPVKRVNVLAAAWIQFMTHDWFAHTTEDGRNHPTRKVELGKGRQMYESLKQPPLAKNTTNGVKDRNSIAASEPKTDETTGGGLRSVHRNLVTHWWDGSQVYGWSDDSERRVRAFADGKLKIGRGAHGDLLPIDPESGQEAAGVRGGWWVGLAFLHTLFAREHNYVATELKKQHEGEPEWNDERIYDAARLIVVAEMAKIHTIEWTPAIIAHPISVAALQSNWNGRINPAAAKSAFDGFRAVNPEAGVIIDHVLDQLGGVVGGAATQHGVDYTLTEEFTSVYRMHPLLPDVLHDVGGKDVPLVDTTGAGSVALTNDEHGGFTSVLKALGTNSAGALTLRNHPAFLRRVPVAPEGGIVLDMAALDIARDRERGVPRYNKFREEIGLGKLTSFGDFIDQTAKSRGEAKNATPGEIAELARQQRMATELEKLYGGDIDSVDLLAGSLAENTRPEGFGFGETSFQIFVLNASRRLLTDRFFNEGFNAENYTQWGLDHIAAETMNTLIQRHFNGEGQLAGALPSGKNAFTPWKDDIQVPVTQVRNKLK